LATKKKTEKTATKSSRSSLVAWVLFTIVSGGGFGGYVNPDLPVVGEVVAGIVARFKAGDLPTAEELADAEEKLRQLAERSLSLGQSLDGREGAEDSLLASAYHAMAQAQANSPSQPETQQQVGVQAASAQAASTRVPTASLFIATFNIQVLGESKLAKPGMKQTLAYILRQFDLVAIQEVRTKQDHILPELVAAINADGSRYSFVIGPRLGRTVSTEQYAYVFNTSTVEHDPSSIGTISDPSDLLHREPLVARFRARTQSPAQAFTFWMVNIHTDPDEVPQEVDALADIFHMMRSARPDEDDVIMLGDLNASETQLGRLGQYPGIGWAVQGTMTNTRQTKAYDNILFHRQATAEFTGRWGVADLKSALGVSLEQALEVSDHLPVWAEFSVWESPGQANVAAGPPGVRR
jgi:endonuclease/exonuclease/phosphatase family metal-dependent hydrolase